MHGVEITELVEKFQLKNMTPDIDTDKIVLTHPEVNRPALQLAGFFDHFDNERVQIIGNVELAYISAMEHDVKLKRYEQLVSSKIPCLLFSRGTTPDEDVIMVCNYYGVPCLVSEKTTSDLMSEVIRWLKVKLAPMISIHGVLVDVFGEGVLIMGESGIGKSEAALELIKRGHRLVTDDVVEIRKVSDDTLVGSAPDITKHLIELRGVGIINVSRVYGAGAVKVTETVDLVVQLEPWDPKKNYQRTGLETEYYDILGVRIPSTEIPVSPGRNLAVVLETAAINNRQKKMGYNAAKELLIRLGLDATID